MPKPNRPRVKARTTETQQLVNVSFPATMLATIDAECNRLGINRQAWIKIKLDAVLQKTEASA